MGGVPTADLLGVAVCLFLSAFFSGSETALTSLSRTRAQQLYEEGGERRSMALLVDHPARVLTTILIGNNLVNIAASALATRASQRLLAGYTEVIWIDPVAVAIGVMTLLLLTFGEVSPKTIARANADRLGPYIMMVLAPMVWLVRPAAAVFLKMSEVLAATTGRPLEEGGPFVREEDIEYLVELGHKEGSLSAERQELLRSAFEFTETTVREVMVPRTDAVFVPIDIDENELLELIVRVGHSRLPVYEEERDNVIGLVYAKDMLRYFRERYRGVTFDLRRYLRRPRFVPESKPISELLREMQANRIHMALVVDEFGGVAGIATLEDIMEEFFGEIRDEYDVESEWIQPLPDGTYRINARVALDDLGEALGFEVDEEEESDTLGAFIAKVTGRVASRGAELEAWGYRFVVEDADPQRVRWVRAERRTSTAKEQAAPQYNG